MKSFIIGGTAGLFTLIIVNGGKILWCTVNALLFGGNAMAYSCVPVTMGEASNMMIGQGLSVGVTIVTFCGATILRLVRKPEENQ